ncbi:MAG: DUF1833 family protein [Pseudomonadota bacterium]
MPDPNLDQAIKEAYAVAPKGQVVIHTMELRHPDFRDDNGNPVAVRVVRAFKDLQARLEADAPMNPGEVVTFTALAFEFQEPELGTGPVPEMPVSMDNVGKTISDQLELAAVSQHKVEVTYRPYLSTQLDVGPKYNPPIHLVLTEVIVTPPRVSAKARMENAADKAYPQDVYTVERFPGLGR